MPRKAKAIPPRMLRVESLSTGREIRQDSVVDDFTGEAIPVMQDQREAKPLPDAHELAAERERAKRKAALALLQRVGLAESEPKLVRRHVPGKRAIVDIQSKDSTRIAFYIPGNPLRRL